ncbi:hypothetical protein [Methylobacterium soli]|uniref:Uncharacterized protein n=1 Tax=Methylobacterium soli TaxID=553447 RepID=A0A6L3SY89_9HYPH|nr:hypothetical protein [Methylobacterium soli]KAB1077176.1 hypothetical protein F6X53_20055 [Methylobacterium soli]GJE42181.1 hypothetical protein AEGHOMDF_1352 [Methylobacterium soli]
MFDVIPEYIHIPSDEGEAAAFLQRLNAERPEIAASTEQQYAATGSARAVLESLVENGTFAGRISDDEARCYDEEIKRYEVEEQAKTKAADYGCD